MTDPRLIAIVSIIFALMGTFSLYTGIRRMRDMRLAGHPVRWYKQISILTGAEYILLTFVFLLTLENQQKTAITVITVPLYFILLLCAAIIAGMVIRQGILDMRTARARRVQPAEAVQTSASLSSISHPSEKNDPEAHARRQRERRKNAAAARRRKAGKA